jgi:hypothetical protein
VNQTKGVVQDLGGIINFLILFWGFFLLGVFVFVAESKNDVVELLLSSVSTKLFSEEPVANEMVETVIRCGISAPSAGNRQPWRFTVVRNVKLMQAIIPENVWGNVLIVVWGKMKRRE